MMYLKFKDREYKIKKQADVYVRTDYRIFVPAILTKLAGIEKNDTVDVYTTEENIILIVPRNSK